MKMSSGTIKQYSFKKEISGGFEIKSLAEFFPLNERFQFDKPHLIGFYAIVFVAEGNGVHEIDFREYTYSTHNILFIKKGQVHAWKEYDSVKGYLMLFTEEFLHKNQLRFKELSYSYPYNTFLHEPVQELTNKQDIKSFQLLVSSLFEEYQLKDSAEKPEILQCLLRTFLLKVQSKKPRVYTQFKTEQKLLFIRFQKLLTEKISESRNVNDYCKWLKVSYKVLNETCKSLTTKTAKAFVDDFILLQTKQMLIHSSLSISEISYRLSFEEPTNFTKFFRKHTSVTPKQFQQTNS